MTSRLHHAIDGIGAIMLIGARFDTTPDAAPAHHRHDSLRSLGTVAISGVGGAPGGPRVRLCPAGNGSQHAGVAVWG